jgi:hypothetical protein
VRGPSQSVFKKSSTLCTISWIMARWITASLTADSSSIIFAEPAILPGPREGSLDDPAPWEHDKALVGEVRQRRHFDLAAGHTDALPHRHDGTLIDSYASMKTFRAGMQRRRR